MSCKRLSIILLCLVPMVVKAQVFNPLDYGLMEATSDSARYNVLLATHEAAVAAEGSISYSGIDSINIAFPKGAKSLPLAKNNDFAGAVVTVTNNQSDIVLYLMYRGAQNIDISAEVIESGDFSSVPQLAVGNHLLLLDDREPWVGERIGYSYPFYRRDVLLISNGKALNRQVAPYNTAATRLKTTFCDIDTMPKRVENLVVVRSKASTFKTYAVAIYNSDNVTLQNIKVITPKSKMTADGTIAANGCTRLKLHDIDIQGTYSARGKYGYAFSMNNLWNVEFKQVRATGKWGVFGTNNMSQVLLEECEVNRFDIHCYGKDVVLRNCRLSDKQTQFSSMYGKVLFDHCEFINTIPLRIRASYNAYTPFDIEFHKCRFVATRRYHSLVNVMLLDTNLNARPELSEKCWPNVTIDTMEVDLQGVRNINIYNPTGTLSELSKKVGHIDKVEIQGLQLNRRGKQYNRATLNISDKKVTTTTPVKVQITSTNAQEIKRGFEE